MEMENGRDLCGQMSICGAWFGSFDVSVLLCYRWFDYRWWMTAGTTKSRSTEPSTSPDSALWTLAAPSCASSCADGKNLMPPTGPEPESRIFRSVACCGPSSFISCIQKRWTTLLSRSCFKKNLRTPPKKSEKNPKKIRKIRKNPKNPKKRKYPKIPRKSEKI